MEGVICAITLITTIPRLKPYLSDSSLIVKWLGYLLAPESYRFLQSSTSPVEPVVSLQSVHNTNIETEYWVNERRQLYVISLPPPAPRPTYFLEFQRIPNGVHLFFTAHLPDAVQTETLTGHRDAMNQALETLRHLVETPAAPH